MKPSIVFAALLLIAPAVLTAGSAADGTWSGEIGTDAAKQTITFVMKTDDVRLSGSIIAGGAELSIQDGTFIGSTLSFSSVQRSGGNERHIRCLGTLTSDAIAFSCTADGKTDLQEFVVTRQKN